MEVSKLINNLAKRAGIPAEDAALKEILSRPELTEIKVPDEVASKIEGSFFTRDEVKNDFEIKKHFTALAHNGTDAQLEAIMDEIGLPDDVKAELKSIKSTPARAAELARKVHEVAASKSKATGKDDDYKKEITTLNEQIKKLREEYDGKLSAKDAELIGKIADMKQETYLSGLNYANKDLAPEIQVAIARQIIEKEASAKGARSKYDPTTGKFKLVRADDETLDWFDERNNKPSYEDFVSGVLAQNKLLAQSEPERVTRGPQYVPPAEPGSSVQRGAFDAALAEAGLG